MATAKPKYIACYVCRLCKKEYGTMKATVGVARNSMFYPLRDEYIGNGPKLRMKHDCDDGGIGVADFIGWRKEEHIPIVDKETWEKAQEKIEGAPRGYKRQDGKLVIDEEQKEAVEAALDRYLKGES